MLKLFKQKNEANPVILLVYGLVLKLGNLFSETGLVVHEDDHLFYRGIVAFLQPLQLSTWFYNLIAFLLIWLQAILFNKVINQYKLFGKSNYLPAMCYLLITSLFPEWNHFSAPLLINSLLIWLFYGIARSFTSTQPRADVFNFGLIAGVITLLYQPAILLIGFVLIGIFIMRPFRIKEWLICFLGVLTPYYFTAIWLLLTDSFSWDTLLPHMYFDIPVVPRYLPDVISLSLLMIPFLVGAWWVQFNLTKMLIQVRKSWSLLLLLLLLAVMLTVLNRGENNYNWLLAAIPLSAFHAAAYHYPRRMWLGYILHWGSFLWCLYRLFGSEISF